MYVDENKKKRERSYTNNAIFPLQSSKCNVTLFMNCKQSKPYSDVTLAMKLLN